MTITLLYGALLALLLLLLSFNVVRLRRRHRVGIGSGGHQPLELAIRAQANFCEYVPLALLLLGLLELSAALPAWALHLLGASLLLGRILHGLIGLNRDGGTSAGRFVGTLLTWLTLAIGAVTGLIVALSRF